MWGKISVALAATIIFACATQTRGLPFHVETVADFDEPWALAFLPDGRMLVTEKAGTLLIANHEGSKSNPVVGVPNVDYGGQGGLGDVALHPNFSTNRMVYLSYAESGENNTRGAAVARGTLTEVDNRPTLENVEVIWRQTPKIAGRGHYGHRLLFDDQGYLWISSGERQAFTPAQDMQANLGKVLRLHDDGSIPADNPFVDYRGDDGKASASSVPGQIWSLGHRNPLGMDFDLDGRLWVIEMGPAGGDELNLVERGANYGYPVVSNGDHYNGRDIPDHHTQSEFNAPAIWWTPVISPADLAVYRGELFADWRGNALVAGLSSRGIVRIALATDGAREVERYDLDARIRSVVEGPDGALWVLEDERDGSKGRLLKITP
jgi:glucose/arabinose dehydrogenase